MKEDNEAYLRELLAGLSPEAVHILLSKYEDKKPRAPKVEHGPVKHYTRFIKNYTCTTCHSSFTVADVLEHGESTSYQKSDGSTGVITGDKKKDLFSVSCVTTYCTCCRCKVKTWDRAILEERFLCLASIRANPRMIW